MSNPGFFIGCRFYIRDFGKNTWPKSNEGVRVRSAEAGVVRGVPGGGVSTDGVSRELRIDPPGVGEYAGVTAAGVTFVVTTLEPKSEPCKAYIHGVRES